MLQKQRTVSDLLKRVADLIKKRFAAKKVILFGSYAYGEPSSTSNIDLLVIMDTNLKFYKQAALIRITLDETLGVFCPMDIIVRTPEEIEKRLREGDFFLKKILEEGLSL